MLFPLSISCRKCFTIRQYEYLLLDTLSEISELRRLYVLSCSDVIRYALNKIIDDAQTRYECGAIVLVQMIAVERAGDDLTEIFKDINEGK